MATVQENCVWLKKKYIVRINANKMQHKRKIGCFSKTEDKNTLDELQLTQCNRRKF